MPLCTVKVYCQQGKNESGAAQYIVWESVCGYSEGSLPAVLYIINRHHPRERGSAQPEPLYLVVTIRKSTLLKPRCLIQGNLHPASKPALLHLLRANFFLLIVARVELRLLLDFLLPHRSAAETSVKFRKWCKRELYIQVSHWACLSGKENQWFHLESKHRIWYRNHWEGFTLHLSRLVLPGLFFWP